ncbi:helix-turn-helix domain-containing protein [Pedobacter sp. UBA5917]|jgi:transcriptional regulator with XRE-family HTH domain|uniref:helix-turn-helix domain-containing protein n=1 Tax=Pedobacter sp. UBA5917 TaxID=1947061 RepID=UPI0025F4EF48|nr:helix-turn-helix transcriptional regulator [Pedobacter sp. UBA5917]
METSEKTKNTHLGRKISRIRELRGMKQETLATALGISQQAISKLEQSEEIEDTTLEKVATVLGVTTEAIKAFSEESIFNYFNTFNDSSSGDFRQHCTFNPLDKVVELYERLLASEREKVELLKNK